MVTDKQTKQRPLRHPDSPPLRLAIQEARIFKTIFYILKDLLFFPLKHVLHLQRVLLALLVLLGDMTQTMLNVLV